MSATDSPPAPLIAACLRITDLRPDVDPLTGAVTRDRLSIGLSAPDAAALEHALRVADTWSGRVVAVSIGPRSIDTVLREVTALGVEVVRVPDDEAEKGAHVSALAGDEQALARAAAAALTGFGGPDLVLCGDRAADRGTGAFPAFLAHELGAAAALGLVRLVAREGARSLLAERRLDGGWREELSVPLPAVCSVEGAGVRLRRAPLGAALAGAEAPIPLDESASHAMAAARERTGILRLGPTRPFEPRTRVVAAPSGGEARQRVLALTGALVAHDPPTVVGPVGAAEAADVLLDYLVRHGYLDAGATTDPGRRRPEESA